MLAYHNALEILGFAHSVYRDVYSLTAKRRKDLGPRTLICPAGRWLSGPRKRWPARSWRYSTVGRPTEGVSAELALRF